MFTYDYYYYKSLYIKLVNQKSITLHSQHCLDIFTFIETEYIVAKTLSTNILRACGTTVLRVAHGDAVALRAFQQGWC